MIVKFQLTLLTLAILILGLSLPAFTRIISTNKNHNVHYLHINNVNITLDSTKDFGNLKSLLYETSPKNIFIEERAIYQKNTKNILKKLRKISNEIDGKLYVVIGKNTWIGKRGLDNTLIALKAYEKTIDGIVLRLEPNKTNIWQNYGPEFKAQMLNHMLDAYSAIREEISKKGIEFVAEFPYWLADFEGPLRNFSQDVCLYADRVILLIDDEDMFETLGNRWNDLFCNYHINISKKANSKTHNEILKLYRKFNSELSFDSYFKGYIIDSDFDLTDHTRLTSDSNQ